MLSIFGFVVIFVFAFFVRKTAKENARSGAFWTLLTIAVGFIFQVTVPILIVVGFALYWRLTGKPIENFQRDAEQLPLITISVGCLVFSLLAVALILRHVAKLPADGIEERPSGPLNLN
jgi:hypothetical protein